MANGGRLGARNVPGVDGYSGVWSLREIANAARLGLWGDRYFMEVSPDSPAAWWRLEETSGTTASDSSGNGNHGTYGTGVTLDQPPLIITGKSITGSSPSTTDPVLSAGAIDPSTVLSAEIWLKRLGAPAANRVIYGLWPTSGWMPWAMFLNSNGTITVNLRYQNSNSGQASVSSPASVADGARHQIGFAWDKSDDQKVHLYVDGAQVAESAAWNQTIYTPSVTRYTQIYQAGSEVIGFDEASIYLSYLDAARFAAHYNAGIA